MATFIGCFTALSLQQQNGESHRNIEKIEVKLSSVQSEKCKSMADSHAKILSLQQQFTRQTEESEVKITSLQLEVLNLQDQIEQLNNKIKQ